MHSEWISVKDKLPEEDQDILYVVAGFDHEKPWVQRGVRCNDGTDWFWCDIDGESGPEGNDGESSHVTHWMPVPEAPK